MKKTATAAMRKAMFLSERGKNKINTMVKNAYKHFPTIPNEGD